MSVVLVVCCTPASVGTAKQPGNRLHVLRFDAGPRGSQLESGAIGVYPDTLYSKQTRYGWTRKPTGEFTQLGLSRSRSALTIDGVVGNRLRWQADLAPGDWHVLLWLETASDGPSTLRLQLQGQRRRLGWQKFAPPAQPTRRMPKTYRVVHALAEVGATGPVTGNSTEQGSRSACWVCR